MKEVLAAQEASGRLLQLAERLAAQDDFKRAAAALQRGEQASFDGVWGSLCALLAAVLACRERGPVVVVLPQAAELDDFCDEFSVWSSAPCQQFPAWELERADQALADDLYGQRLRLVRAVSAGALPQAPEVATTDRSSGLIVTSIQALLQPIPGRERMRAMTRTLERGERQEIEPFIEWMLENGLARTSAVELPGEFSSRGGIVDIFPPDAEAPVRVEWFGDEVESIRTFDVATQRSAAECQQVEITVLRPSAVDRDSLLSVLPASSRLLLVEPEEMTAAGARFVERWERPAELLSVKELLREADRFGTATAQQMATSPAEVHCRMPALSVERFSGEVAKVRSEIDDAARKDDVWLFCRTEAEVKRLREVLATTETAHDGRLHFSIGHLRSGFRLPPERLVVLSGSELFHRTEPPRPPKRRLGRAIDSFTELREGDLIVHLAHGVGRYRGLALIEKEGSAEEHLALEFDGGTKIYVPATRISLVQKYVGGSKSRPRLAKIGGRSWVRQRAAAEQAVTDLAVDMLELQAARGARPGIAFPADSEWQREFDASFPYQETDDQLLALTAIKDDMHRSRPMDRLLCGDVGFGKTEVAMRAAFKAVDSGHQVAVLVPTTILAEQHLVSFQSRMAEFPFSIAALSRFSTKGQQNEIIARLAEGGVDIIIGTHRLASADVKFSNLGLVIIDEEQRFGVEVKERLKRLREMVELFSLSCRDIV
ncbi:MAG: DEAD/DEAH box helicase, partial [Planctomycetia bacterium]|nr:DEAD/DEAH box helicase [Planctomycetia bacterium]